MKEGTAYRIGFCLVFAGIMYFGTCIVVLMMLLTKADDRVLELVAENESLRYTISTTIEQLDRQMAETANMIANTEEGAPPPLP